MWHTGVMKRSTRSVWLGAVVLGVAPLLLLAYFRVGWWRMEADCTAEPPGTSRDTSSVAFSWSWRPLGFTCAFPNGGSETSLWF